MTTNSNPQFYARRKDKNHDAIARALQAASYHVCDTHKQAEGFPDVLVSDGERVVLFEIKIPGEKLTKKERRWFAIYPGAAFVVFDETEAIERMRDGKS